MSDVEFVKIISILCLSVQFGRRSMKSIQEDCNIKGRVGPQAPKIIFWMKPRHGDPDVIAN